MFIIIIIFWQPTHGNKPPANKELSTVKYLPRSERDKTDDRKKAACYRSAYPPVVFWHLLLNQHAMCNCLSVDEPSRQWLSIIKQFRFYDRCLGAYQQHVYRQVTLISRLVPEPYISPPRLIIVLIQARAFRRLCIAPKEFIKMSFILIDFRQSMVRRMSENFSFFSFLRYLKKQ